MAERRSQIQDIETLRGVSIALVLIAHAHFLLPWGELVHGLTSRLKFGAGVDLFFVISGYVITMSLFREMESGRFAPGQLLYRFWIRRFFRLIPPALLVIAATVLVVGLFGSKPTLAAHGDFEQTLWGAFAALTEWMNIWGYLQIINGRGFTLLAHFWSLSLEEQFYLLWPILVVLLGSRRRLASLALIVLAIYSFFDRYALSDPAWWFRIDGLCWGTVIYLLADKWRDVVLTRTLAVMLTALGLLALLASTAVLGPSPFASSASTLGATLCVFVAAMDRDALQGQGWVSALFNYLGSRSYTIYLWHLLIFVLVQLAWLEFLPDLASGFSTWLAIGICLSVLPFVTVIEFSYSLVERHGRQTGRRLAERIGQQGRELA